MHLASKSHNPQTHNSLSQSGALASVCFSFKQDEVQSAVIRYNLSGVSQESYWSRAKDERT